MEYRAFGNRVAVAYETLGVPIPLEDMLAILKEKGIRVIDDVDIVAIAKSLVGKAKWKLPSGVWEAPHYFDCAGLTRWLYGQIGIWIPRRPIQQYEFCSKFYKIVSLEDVAPADLLFVSSPYMNGRPVDNQERIGHVCIVSGKHKAICATNSEFGTGVVEIAFEELFKSRTLGAVGRIVDDLSRIHTFLTPPNREIDSSDDIKWIILKSV